MTPTLHVDRFVDARGQLCPMPVLSLAQAFRELQPGEVLAISATDQGAKSDIAAWAEKSGNHLREVKEAQGVLTFYLQKPA